MTEREIVGKSFTINKGAFKDRECIVTGVSFTIKYMFDVEIHFLGKTIYTALSEEALGITIDEEIAGAPADVVEKSITNFQTLPGELFNPPAESAELSKLQKSLGFNLPESFMQFYSSMNGNILYGQQYEYALLGGKYSFLPVEQIIETREFWNGLLSDYVNDSDRYNRAESGGGQYLYWYWNPRFVPFFAGEYNLYVLDPLGIKTGNKQQVICFNAFDEPGAGIIHTSFEKCLETLNCLMEKELLLNEDVFSTAYSTVYQEINGKKTISLHPSEINSHLEWDNLYHGV